MASTSRMRTLTDPSVGIARKLRLTSGKYSFMYPIKNQQFLCKIVKESVSSGRLSKTLCFPWEIVKESVAESLAPPLHEDPHVHSRRCSHPPERCRDLGSLPEADQATGAVSPTLLALHPWHQMAKPRVERRSPQESQPAQHRVHLASGAAALGWPSHEDGKRTHAQSSLLQRASRRKERSWRSKKALQRSAEETACTGGNQPLVMAAEGLRPRQLALISEKSQLWVRGKEAYSRREKTQEAERGSSIPTILIPNLRLSKVR